jgi:hypothetical protein
MLELADPELREVLRALQDEDRRSDRQLEALTATVLAGLALPVAASSAASAAVASGAAAGAASTASMGAGAAAGASLSLPLAPALWMTGATLLSLGLGASWLVARHAAEPNDSALRRAHSVAGARSQPAPVEPKPAPAVETAASAEALVADAPEQAPSAKPVVRVRASGRVAEVELLRRAHAAMSRAPRAALGLLAMHRREYREGALVEEREALTIEALWRAERHDEASEHLRTFAERYPRSGYLERLRSILR